MAIRSILDLPFRERPPLELLGFDDGRAAVDVDYAGFGWARIDRVWLASRAGDAVEPVGDALVLALHAADDSPTLADDLELEFAVDDRPVTVLLSGFLARWLPQLPTTHAIVLALCNPHRARLRGPRPLHYGLGAVDAWLDTTDDGDHLRLLADAWRRTEDP